MASGWIAVQRLFRNIKRDALKRDALKRDALKIFRISFN